MVPVCRRVYTQYVDCTTGVVGNPVNALDEATAGKEIVELYGAWLLSSFHVNVHITGQHNWFGVRGQTIEYAGELVEEHWTDRASAVDSSTRVVA